jgi:lysophospholipase L1-like esterase
MGAATSNSALAQTTSPSQTSAAGRGAPAPTVVGPADVPAPRSDQNSLIAHEELLQKARAGGIDVYFAGDSIARRWGALDYPQLLENFRQNFFGWNAGNFGWGADRIQNILWRLEHGELDGVHPKVIVILGGTNNIGPQPGTEATIAEVTRGLAAVLYLCRTKAPDATIILTAIFPRNDRPGLWPAIVRVNANLARMADGKRVRYLDVNDKLADVSGTLVEGVMNPDNLHPTLKGYQVWADGLKPLLTELLGPPAATDHAPPATGDPSARGRGGH